MSNFDNDDDVRPSWSIEDDGDNTFNTSRSAYFDQSQVI
jgi:hypothetical protein